MKSDSAESLFTLHFKSRRSMQALVLAMHSILRLFPSFLLLPLKLQLFYFMLLVFELAAFDIKFVP